MYLLKPFVATSQRVVYNNIFEWPENKIMSILDGKVVIVTGATSGIGEATAMEVVREGGIVILAARRKERGDAIVAKIKHEGGTALFVQTDVTVEEDIKNLVNHTIKKYGRLDAAFNNAGTLDATGTLEVTATEAYENLMNLNLRAIYWSMKYEIPEMRKSGGGAIVNTSSLAGIMGIPQSGVYAAAKHGVIGLTKTAAMEFAGEQIRVNCVLPGPIKTELWDRLPDGQQILQNSGIAAPMNRYGKPVEVAKPVVFLLSEGASYITGTQLIIDGGHAA